MAVERCHPEPVEGYVRNALPAMLRRAQHNAFFFVSF